MADHKEYINQTLENGNVMISEDVIETIVAHAVGEVEGVAGLSNAKSRGKSMKITISQDDELSIECNIIVIYIKGDSNIILITRPPCNWFCG